MNLSPLILLATFLSTSLAFVRTGPHIVREPVDTLYDQGSNIQTLSLFCEAEGEVTPTITWRKDGADLDLSDSRFIQTQDRLTISALRKDADEGTYQCVVSNAYGTIFSTEAELKFAYVDQYPLTPLDPVSLQLNTGACISCSPPDHYPGLDVIWQKDNSGVTTDLRIRTTIDGRLCFANVETTDEGLYHCLVKSSVDSLGAAVVFKASPRFQVTVQSGSASAVSSPRVLVDVPDTTIKAGRDATLECFFSGSPHPTLQWRRKSPADAPLPSTPSNENQELIIRNAQPEDSGEYECLASNDQEQNVKSTGTLTVVSAPSWLQELEDTDIDIMSSLTWRCEAESVYDITYEWYRNAQLINTGFDRISFSDNFRTATFTSLEESDSAMYQCVARNEHGSVVSTAQLKVNAIPPSFPVPVQSNQPAARGGSVLILCNPDGAPKPTIKWYRGSSRINTGGRFNVTEEGHLYITGVVDSDFGDYRCEATNTFSTESSTGSLVIKDGTNIIHPPADATIVIGHDDVIQCGATADEDFELIYIWLFDGSQLNIDDNPHYRKEDGNLHLLSVNQDMQGEYTCRAETSIDADMVSAIITVSGPPDPPTAVDVVLEEFLAELSWIPGDEHNSPTTGYVIESKTNHRPNWMEERTVNSISTTVTISELSPWSTYQFRVSAMSARGVGEPSAPSAEVVTEPAEPSVSPTDISGGGGNQGDLRITWQPLDGADQNGPGIYYIVHWKQESSTNQFATAEVRTGENIHIVSNMPVYTPYEVKLQAGNEAGTGPISATSIVYSYQEAPTDAPTMVNSKSYSETELVLEWDPVDDSNFQGVLTGYRIYYWPQGTSQEEADTVETDGVVTTAMLEDLEAATSYSIVIEALSGGGEGPASIEITGTTKKMAPLTAPQIEKAVVQKDNSVKLTWNSITTGSTEESLIGYKILFWKHGTFMDSALNVTVPKGVTSFKLEKLDPKTTYYVKVRAYSSGGDGALSDQQVVETGKPTTGSLSDDDNGNGCTIKSFTSLIASLILICIFVL
ncbi:contactin-4-like [Apostichopus japonicus]|uniref:contactin-4-like n=1 Tax=Stichopus japonicus TaxID=307972 RepID=UPI003AB24271